MGKQVRLINRSGKADRLPEGAEIVVGDAYDVNKNTELTKGAYAVYQCAQPLYHEWVEKFPRFQSAIMEASRPTRQSSSWRITCICTATHTESLFAKTCPTKRIPGKARFGLKWQML